MAASIAGLFIFVVTLLGPEILFVSIEEILSVIPGMLLAGLVFALIFGSAVVWPLAILVALIAEKIWSPTSKPIALLYCCLVGLIVGAVAAFPFALDSPSEVGEFAAMGLIPGLCGGVAYSRFRRKSFDSGVRDG
jgi:hypothetical protein